MLKAYALTVLATVLWECAVPGAAWKGKVEWPDDDSRKNIVPFTEAGAALAAAAIREMVRTPTPVPSCRPRQDFVRVRLLGGLGEP
jgi:hypothetical protein